MQNRFVTQSDARVDDANRALFYLWVSNQVRSRKSLVYRMSEIRVHGFVLFFWGTLVIPCKQSTSSTGRHFLRGCCACGSARILLLLCLLHKPNLLFQWLRATMNAVGSLVAASVVATVLWQAGNLGGSSAGLTLSYATQFTQAVMWLFRIMTTLEVREAFSSFSFSIVFSSKVKIVGNYHAHMNLSNSCISERFTTLIDVHASNLKSFSSNRSP